MAIRNDFTVTKTHRN